MKKFKELQKGDVIWCLDKKYLEDGIDKYIVLEDWKLSNINEGWQIWVKGKEKGFYLTIPKSSFSKSNSSQLYKIFATTEDELFRISKRLIIKEAERLDKRILETKEILAYYEGLREKLDKLLIQVENE